MSEVSDASAESPTLQLSCITSFCEGLPLTCFQSEARSSSRSSEAIRQFKYSLDGKYLFYTTIDSIMMVSAEGKSEPTKLVADILCLDFSISPMSNYLCTFEKHIVPKEPAASPPANLSVWHILGHEKEPPRADKIVSFVHKNQGTWSIHWSSDERHFGRLVSSEVQFFAPDSDQPGHAVYRIPVDAATMAVAQGADLRVALFLKGAKGAPASVRIYDVLKDCNKPAAFKAFYKADNVRFEWSPTGKHLLALTHTDKDDSGKSYYGESNLYFMLSNGTFDCRVDLDAEGPIHDIAWSPAGNEFIVVYGYMPAKTTLFDAACKAIYDFENGPKNTVRFNPNGSLICLAGFGNLAGTIDVYDRSRLKRIGEMKAPGSSVVEWSPCGRYLLTAILTPRLRVDNGYHIWRWNGEQVMAVSFAELYQVVWRPMSHARFPPIVLDKTESVKTQSTGATKKSEPYRPPSLRGLPSVAISPNSSRSAADSKAPPKNAVRKTARRESALAVSGESSNGPQIEALNSASTKEDKEIRKLHEKLANIALLKKKQDAGAPLELNQIEKMNREPELRKDLELLLHKGKQKA